MRADRLVSLVLLLRQRGRMTAREIATELEVSTRTVLRDMEALSAAGVPVYADRGRHGGFSLLPGFRAELAGLNHDEALALLTAGSAAGHSAFGLTTPLASAIRKVVDALPDGRRADVTGAAQRLLVEPETDLLSRAQPVEVVDGGVLAEVRDAVLTGHRVELEYAAPGRSASRQVVDPIGLVTVRGRAYLLATKVGADRTYRLSRMTTARKLPEMADRPTDVDLGRIWAERSAEFLSENHLCVRVRVAPSRRAELLDAARELRTEETAAGGWLRLEVTFEDLRHAVWALWQLGTDVYVLSPDALRDALRARADGVVALYRS